MNVFDNSDAGRLLASRIAEIMDWKSNEFSYREWSGFLIASKNTLLYTCRTQREIAYRLWEKMVRSGYMVAITAWRVGKTKVEFRITAVRKRHHREKTVYEELIFADVPKTGDIEADEAAGITDLFIKVFEITEDPIPKKVAP